MRPRLHELVSMEAAPMMRDHAAQGFLIVLDPKKIIYTTLVFFHLMH